MRKKKIVQPTLFPGYLLKHLLIKSLQHGACVIGDTFEVISSYALSANRLAVNSHEDYCPDLDLRGIEIECKAFGSDGRRCLVHIEQLDRYVNSVKSSYYIFWNYSFHRPVRGNPPIIDLIERVSSTIVHGVVLDVSIVNAMRHNMNKVVGLGFREAVMRFKGRAVFTRDYLIISRKIFDRFKWNYKEVLLDLNLDPKQYIMTTERRRISFKVNGLVLKTNYFNLYRILPVVPF